MLPAISKFIACENQRYLFFFSVSSNYRSMSIFNYFFPPAPSLESFSIAAKR